MCPSCKDKYIRDLARRYTRASRPRKTALLDEACAVLNMHRKSVIRALARARRPKPKPPGRPVVYGPDVLKALSEIWLAADQPCSKRLVALLPIWLPFYDKHNGPLGEEVAQKLRAVSAATVDRLLAPVRAKQRKGAKGRRVVNQLRGQIPIRTHFENVSEPGWIEADTVAHSGESMSGAFVWTLTLVDIYTGWTECRALWNKNGKQTARRIGEIEQSLPFEMLGLDSDNGSEFINSPVLMFLRKRDVPIEVTRSRPYRKNDNAHVEQRQFSHVRQLLGYDRFESEKLIPMLNDLYANEFRLLHNFFLPSMFLLSKERRGARIIRHHTKPCTPFQRLVASQHLDARALAELQAEYEGLDPILLHQSCQAKLKKIFTLVRNAARRKAKKAT
jgi:hypothetical protein